MVDCNTRYKKLFKKLFPWGFAWEAVKEDELGLLQGMADEFCRVEARGADLLEEFDPGTALELLEDWEELLGIPDECTELALDLTQRRIQARQKLAAVGGLNAAYYEGVAEQLGFDAIVTDILDFRVGRSRVGERLSNPYNSERDQFRVGSPLYGRVGMHLKRFGWRYVFEVNVEATDVSEFRVGTNRVGDPLRLFENPLLECTIQRLKPAHTFAFFTFR